MTTNSGNMDVPAVYLENCTDNNGIVSSPEGDDLNMASKNVYSVMVNGRRHWIRASSQQEFADKLLALNSQPTAPTAHDFKAYATTWFEVYSRPTVATATAKTYERQLRLYLIPAFDGMTVEEITTDDVQQLFNDIGGSKAKKDKVKQVLNMVFESAKEDGFLTKNPLESRRLRIVGTASKTTEPYTLAEMQAIIKHIPNVKSPVDRAYIALQALHPLRLEEVLGLKWEDIDLKRRCIYVRRAVTHPDRNQPEVKETKTQASARTLALSTTALAYLTPGEPGDYVIGGAVPFSYSKVRRMCYRIGQDMLFDGDITPIRFRATVLTDIYDQSKDIKLTQAAAGHTTSAMTLKYYVKGREDVSKVTASVIDAAYRS